jgi:AcrR family transcriptional regulator
MTEVMGRREANKLATRQALQDAADRLFEKQGFSKTTVREIADAAGVTERTFFRYFTGKEDLIVDDALSWLTVLQDRVRDRPSGENPVTALRRAVLGVTASLAETPRPSPLWMYREGPRGGRINGLTLRAIMEAEVGLSEVLTKRLARSAEVLAIEDEYLAEVLARTAVAVVRCALIRDWELRKGGTKKRPSAATLVNQAFSVIQMPAARNSR